MGGGRGNREGKSAEPIPPTVDPFSWHGINDEICEPPQEVVDYLDAVHNGDLGKLKSAISSGAHVDTCHRCGMTGLIIAADIGDCDIVKCLLESGADVHALWSNQAALFYAQRNKDGDCDALERESEAKLGRRRTTLGILQEWSAKTPIVEDHTTLTLPSLEDPEVPPSPPLKYKATAAAGNIKELIQVISNEEQTEWDREDATWALRAMTDPALEQRKRNVTLLISTGAVEPLIDLLSDGPNPRCKEQAITVLRNICREASPSQRKVTHKIRKAMREEVIRGAGLGTAESSARIEDTERRVSQRGGVCVVSDRRELARLAEDSNIVFYGGHRL